MRQNIRNAALASKYKECCACVKIYGMLCRKVTWKMLQLRIRLHASAASIGTLLILRDAYAQGQKGRCTSAHAHGDSVGGGGGAGEDYEDKDEDVEAEGGAAHAHGDCVWECL